MKKRFLMCLIITIIFSYSAIAQQITVQLGPEQTVFDWTTQKCADDDIPDTSARAFGDVNGNIQLISTHFTNRRFIGSSLNTVSNTCPIIMSSSLNSNPSQYNDHEWITAPYTFDGQTIYTLVHDEYQGYLYNSCNSYASCWYNAITFAVSTDAGATYAQAPAPNHLAASMPYQYVNNIGFPYGYFGPSNIIYKDGYYYSFLQVEPYQNVQSWGACPMRTQNIADPTSWRFWDGTGFNNVPVNPYTTTVATPTDHLCQPLSQQNIGKMMSSITYNTYLGKYIMIGVHQVGTQAGFFYSLSTDLINWGPPQLIMDAVFPWMSASQGPGGGQWQLYPVLLEETSSRNFEITGQMPYLYYTKKNPNNLQPSLDRDLVRRQITFTIIEDYVSPGAPSTHYSTAIGSTQIQLIWLPATDNFGVAGYIADVALDPSFTNFVPGWQNRDLGNTLTSYVSGLNAGTTYYSKIRAYDAAGNIGPNSNTATVATQQPLAQFDFALSTYGQTTVAQGNSLSNTITANIISGASQAVSFNLSGLPQGASASFSSTQCSPTCSANLIISTSSTTPTGNYPITITASSGSVTRIATINLNIIQSSDATPPSAPGILTVTAISSSQINLNWLPAADNVGVTTYLIDISPMQTFSYYIMGWLNRNVGNVLTTSATGLNAGTTYYIRLKAADAAGNTGDYGNIAQIATLTAPINQTLNPPTTPILNQAVYNYSQNSIILTWSDSNNEQGYYLEKSIPQQSDFVLIAALPSNATSYQDTNVNPGNSYLYRIKAFNSLGNSSYTFAGITAISPSPQNTKQIWTAKLQEVKRGEAGKFIINNALIPVREIIFTPSVDSSQIVFLIESLSIEEIPETILNMDNLLYPADHIKITTENLEIESAKIRFRVQLNYIQNITNIKLVKYSNSLEIEELPTNFTSMDRQYAYYEALTTSFSGGFVIIEKYLSSTSLKEISISWTMFTAIIILILITCIKLVRKYTKQPQ